MDYIAVGNSIRTNLNVIDLLSVSINEQQEIIAAAVLDCVKSCADLGELLITSYYTDERDSADKLHTGKYVTTVGYGKQKKIVVDYRGHCDKCQNEAAYHLNPTAVVLITQNDTERFRSTGFLL